MVNKAILNEITLYIPPPLCYSTDDLENVQAANERGGVSV